ncbi:MAG: AAA family ATPase [Pseudomonadota bacterium]
MPIEACSVFVGANGVGKTNLYNALAKLRAAADGRIAHSVAQEGGIESVFWAGVRQKGRPARIALRAEFAELDFGGPDGVGYTYEIELGLPRPTDAAFSIEPLVKVERLTSSHRQKPIVMMERKGPAVTLRDENGKRVTYGDAVLASETALAAFRDAVRYPELEAVRREMLDWRFYHDFRTDAGSPIRGTCNAITTPTLSPDGHDLAAVLATLFQIRQDTSEIDAAIDDAFPGAMLWAGDVGSSCRFELTFPDMPRPFQPHELSDGTLKYLCLLGALMGYRLPALVAINEPEASLHPDLLEPLARLIARSAYRTQIWIVTHSEVLSSALEAELGARVRRVVKTEGATEIEGLTLAGDWRDHD